MNATHRCDCGCTPPHGTEDECARNRAATWAYQRHATAASLDSSIARGALLAAGHDAHMRAAYGCNLCPLDSRFVRDSADAEWYIPAIRNRLLNPAL